MERGQTFQSLISLTCPPIFHASRSYFSEFDELPIPLPKSSSQNNKIITFSKKKIQEKIERQCQVTPQITKSHELQVSRKLESMSPWGGGGAVAQLVGALSCTSKCCGFNCQSRHIPRLLVQFLFGPCMGGNGSMFFSLSHSPIFSL